jgi:hypothetical protein
MNDLVNGLKKIRNAILGGQILSIIFILSQYIVQKNKNQDLRVFTLIVNVLILIFVIVYIAKYFAGIRLIRNLNIFEKLNTRLVQVRNNFRTVLGLSFVSIPIILFGTISQSVYGIYTGLFILLIGIIFMWITTYRTIQIQGLLGVYAKSQDLIKKTIKILTLFKIQIVMTIISYLSLYLKDYSLYVFYVLQTISILYYLYFVINYLILLNLSIYTYEDSQAILE